MSPFHVSPTAARIETTKKYLRHAGNWAVAAPESPAVTLPLHPPTEQAALALGKAAIDWTASWVGIEGVLWGERRWASLGRQSVPERLQLVEPSDVAQFCQKTAHWRRLSSRAAQLLVSSDSSNHRFSEAVARSATALEALNDTDFVRLLGVLAWLAANPDSGMYIRQLPVRGVDSKWVGTHRSLVERLHTAANGASNLGLATAPSTIRVRFLDPAHRPAGLEDVSAPVDSLNNMNIAPRTVFVFENLESVLALPDMDNAVVVHGSGYAVDRLAAIGWISKARIVYWGDLDTHGFAILNRFRASGLPITTVLMDVETLDAYADLWVPEPKPAVGSLNYLLPAEREVVQALAARGGVRLEQERIQWAHCLAILEAALR